MITNRALKSGEVVECVPLGLMEQFEDGVDDHNVLARLADEDTQLTTEIESRLTDFVINVFKHIPEKRVAAGRFRSAEDALAHIETHRDPQ